LATPCARTLVRPTQPGTTVSGPEDSFAASYRFTAWEAIHPGPLSWSNLRAICAHDRLATHAPDHLSGPRTYWVDTRVRDLCYLRTRMRRQGQRSVKRRGAEVA